MQNQFSNPIQRFNFARTTARGVDKKTAIDLLSFAALLVNERTGGSSALTSVRDCTEEFIVSLVLDALGCPDHAGWRDVFEEQFWAMAMEPDTAHHPDTLELRASKLFESWSVLLNEARPEGWRGLVSADTLDKVIDAGISKTAYAPTLD